MTSRRLGRGRAVAVLTAVLFLLAVGACQADDDPAPEPSAAGYEQPPEDLCAAVSFEEVLQRWELSVPEKHGPGSDYRTERAWWYTRCNFTGMAEDGRFETALEAFRPNGAVRLSVYHDVADAVDEYERVAHDFAVRSDDPELGATAVEVTGWWDTGTSLQLVEELDPEDYVVGDFEITSLGIEWLVRHQNLVARVDVAALSPTDDTAEASALLRELAVAVLDEAVGHLRHSTG